MMFLKGFGPNNTLLELSVAQKSWQLSVLFYFTSSFENISSLGLNIKSSHMEVS